MTDDAIPLNKIGKIGTVKVYNQAYVDKQQKRIVELEEENAELKKACDETQELLDKQIEATLKLDKENAELDCQKNRNKFCYSCANATERCFRNEIGCPCEKYKSWKEENQKWKDEWQEQVQKATDEGYARTLQTIQLTKAKEIIEKVAKMYRYSPRVDEIIEQAEQFLNSEVEK